MTEFFKLSGAGNDFLALVEPEVEPRAESIRAWCARGLSIGADGLFTLAREADGAARMIHYNADGGRAELCVNGTRCAARLAFHLGWAADEIIVRTDSGDVTGRPVDSTEVEIEIAAPTETPAPMTLEAEGAAIDGWFLRVGVPHFVIAWEDQIAAAPVATLGPGLRAHPDLGASGANVHWVRYEPPDRFAIRSFERGVEAETLACGSGILAATAVGLRERGIGFPVRALARSGLELVLDSADRAAQLGRWTLTADARLVAAGELLG